MLRSFYLLLLLLVPFGGVLAIEGSFSHGVYYLPDPIYKGKINPYIEIYWQLNPKKVHYNTNADKKILARIKTDVTIIDDTGHTLKSDTYIFETVPVTDVAQLSTLNILELKRYFVRVGKFRLTVRLKDLNDTNNVAVYTDTFEVAETPRTAFYSDIELVDTVYTSDIRTPFRKHGKQYIPLCENFFDTYRESLSYYSELYNLDKVAAMDYPLYHTAFISRKPGQSPLAGLQVIDTIQTNETTYKEGSFDISDLRSGNYYLTLSLGDKLHKTIATKTIFIQRANTRPPKVAPQQQAAKIDSALETVTVLDLTKTFLKKYDMGQIKAILKMLLPVSDQAGTRAIEGFLKEPNDMYMRYFIYNYFKGVNSANPDKAWKDYSDKVKEVNRMFTKGSTAGYETQRGFMYLRYGAPTEVITTLNEKGALPYELWQYDQLKDMTGKMVANAVILFYKASEADPDFRVLHTTITGEVHNTGWRSFLYYNSDGGANYNSRAEQFIGSR